MLAELQRRLAAGQTLKLQVKVKPGAKRPGLKLCRGDYLELAVAAVPEQGKANDAVIKLLAAELGIAKSRITLLRGQTSRDKWLTIT